MSLGVLFSLQNASETWTAPAFCVMFRAVSFPLDCARCSFFPMVPRPFTSGSSLRCRFVLWRTRLLCTFTLVGPAVSFSVSSPSGIFSPVSCLVRGATTSAFTLFFTSPCRVLSSGIPFVIGWFHRWRFKNLLPSVCHSIAAIGSPPHRFQFFMENLGFFRPEPPFFSHPFLRSQEMLTFCCFPPCISPLIGIPHVHLRGGAAGRAHDVIELLYFPMRFLFRDPAISQFFRLTPDRLFFVNHSFFPVKIFSPL